MTVRTRFAPSPTGYLHIGGARTALYSWAFARRHGGKFILRIEDTDAERSTRESEDAILDSMKWLGLDWDEGPFFQMQRLARYREVAERLIASGDAYHCWATKEELDAMREAQRARGEKPRYDGRWRPERAKAAGLLPPKDRSPVVRFRTPEEGTVGWNDLVKGPIEFANTELDDLVILRADGVPTYNFGVVVDDLDMRMTHVIRGDDHVNNTPRQIHIWRSLGSALPEFAHVPMILGADGERLSKRHGAVSVTQYRDEGFLPEALVNYLARLGWSHGDDEVFSMRELVEWFDLAHVSRSPAKFDPEKLAWLNQQYLRKAAVERTSEIAKIATRIQPELAEKTKDGPPLEPIIQFYSGRSHTVGAVSTAAMGFLSQVTPTEEQTKAVLSKEVIPAIKETKDRLEQLRSWDKLSISEAIKAVLHARGLKMPQVANALRLIVWGDLKQVPIDEGLAMRGREFVLSRLDSVVHG
jgi:glutamyl-tRNA synthetase